MAFRIGLAQSGYPADGDVLSQARNFMQRAGDEGCDLLVFPENFMWPRKLSAAELRELGEPVDGTFVQGVAAAARDVGLWVVFTMNETNPAGGQPFNTAVAVDDAGAVRGAYRKCHLYDALGVRESDRLSRGDGLAAPAPTPFCTLGLAVCYDLRFPELARSAVLAGCDMLVYPAAWHAGPCKVEQWKTLLAARAIENEVFVAGVCRSGRGFTGHSVVFDPMGRCLCEGADGTAPDGEDALLTCEIDLSVVASTREAMPILEHRRPELYR